MSKQETQRERLFLPAQEIRVQQSADGRRSIAGYAAVFHQPSQDLGNFTEVIAPGAFSKTLKANGDVLCLRDHDPSILLGRTKANTLTLLEDAIGLRFICDLPNTTQADDLTESIRRGDLDGVSFGFRAQKDEWAATSDGSLVRTLLQVDLYEISPCSFPAYPAASVSLRSCPLKLLELAKLSSENLTSSDDENRTSELSRMQMRLALAQRR